MTTSERRDLAEEILKLYVSRRRETGGITVTDELMERAMDAADKCHEAGVTSAEYIKALEEYLPEKARQAVRPFPPACLNTKNAVDYCRSYVESYRPDFEAQFLVQVNYLRCVLKNFGRGLEETLMDDSIDLQPWFRLMISRVPIKQVFDKYGEEAKKQLNVNEHLRKFCLSKGLTIT